MDKATERRLVRKAMTRHSTDAACFEGLGETSAAQHTEAFRKLDQKITEEMLREAGLLKYARSRSK